MQFLRTLFWVVLAVFVAIVARNNWFDVTINLWGSLQADIKLPVLVLLGVLTGFLPTFLVLRARLWSLKRRLLTIRNQPGSTAGVSPNPPETPDVLEQAV